MTKFQSFRLLIVAFSVSVFPACSFVLNDRSEIILMSPEGEEVVFLVEIADSSTEHQKGLMFRESLEKDTGMLFIFESDRQLSFWMKNTLIPLDVIFFDEEGMFVSWTSMEPCKADPCARYSSDGPGKYALEIPAGTAKRLGIQEEWSLVVESW